MKSALLLVVALCTVVLLPGCGGSSSMNSVLPLQVITASLPSGALNASYSATLSSSGGKAPFTWGLAAGHLPTGLTLSTLGIISGVPSEPGSFSFTVQVSDGEAPPGSATAQLSIRIDGPPRDKAFYFSQIIATIGESGALSQSGFNSPLSYSSLAVSPTLPLIFGQGFDLGEMNQLSALQVNADYSLTTMNTTLLISPTENTLAVDPTGANLYVAGALDNNGTQLLVFSADGSFTPVSNLAIAGGDISLPPVFTPDAKLAFTISCPASGSGNILSLARATDGTISQVSSTAISNCGDVHALGVSPDGHYLATTEVQVYSIAPDGTLNSVLPAAFQVTLNGLSLTVSDLVWDASSSYLLVNAISVNNYMGEYLGGVAVLSFSGTSLTEAAEPVGAAGWRITRTGSYIYADAACLHFCIDYPVWGYNFSNAQLSALPGSPYFLSFPNSEGGQMVIY